MKTILNIFFYLSIAVFISSCKKDDIEDENVICTMQFETVYMYIPNKKLDKFHTIRLATGDTLKKDTSRRVYETNYPVVDDSFQKILRGRTETFRFQGFVRDSLVVNEDIKVSANVCHIYYVSGKLNID